MKERKRNGKLILFISFLIVRKNGDRQNWFPVSIIEQAEIMIHSFMKFRLSIALWFYMNNNNCFHCLLFTFEYKFSHKNIQRDGPFFLIESLKVNRPSCIFLWIQ